MTLVGVISDTHGTLHARAYEALAGCDRIIHAGDICGLGILRELETLAPVTAVLGNNDFDEYGARVQRIARPTIDGVKFLVAHYPQDVRVRPGDAVPDICIHGHTHVPRLAYGADARPAGFVLCPGSASYPRGGSERSIAKVVLEDGRVRSVRIETLGRRALISDSVILRAKPEESPPIGTLEIPRFARNDGSGRFIHHFPGREGD